MTIVIVQHVTQAASEGLNAKFSDLCDPHDLFNVRTSKRGILKLSAKSRGSSTAMRHLRKQERRLSASSSADGDALLMEFVPLSKTPDLSNGRHSLSIFRMGSPSPALHSPCSTPRKKSRGVTKKLLRLCNMSSSGNKYLQLPVY
uniref:Uncharacterized protein n=1 Tax=Physcomitrium patens TaxID=3218 RepID=A0A2K1KV22_PHYPA|nr:hypothetical protein PHYPA_004623 [Physcomitrium patens]